MSASDRRHILLTGAAGRIGTRFYSAVKGTYRFRLADRDDALLDLPMATGDSSHQLNIADFGQVVAACDGIDTVVHLAANPNPDADFETELLASNIQGTYNVFEAAARTGCRRVIFASSVHAVAGHPTDIAILESASVWPLNMYGVSKCFGEATARAYASTRELSCIAIRIGAYENPGWMTSGNQDTWRSAFISPRDLNQLLVKCIESPDVDFAIVHGISNNRQKRLSIEATRDLLGYEPVDDGFEKVM